MLINTSGCIEVLRRVRAKGLKDVRAQNVLTHRFFLNLPRRKVMIYFCQKGQKKKKNGGVTDFVLERTFPEKYPKSEKSGFVN